MKSNAEMDRIPPLPNDIEAIIFDCDGTLVDTMPFHLEAWAQICDETGLYYSKESFIAKAGIPGREIIRTMAERQGIFLDVMNVYNRKKALYLQAMRRATPASLPISCVVNFAVEAKAINDSILFGVATGSSRYQVEQGIALLYFEKIRGKNCFKFRLADKCKSYKQSNQISNAMKIKN